MQHGPNFLRSIMKPDYTSHCHQCNPKINAYTILKNEWDGFEERQFGDVSGTLPRWTLINCLKLAIARKAEYTVEKVYNIAWATIQNEGVLRRTSSLVDLVCAQ